MNTMIFYLSPRHIALTVCVVFPYGYEIIKRLTCHFYLMLSVFPYINLVVKDICDWQDGTLTRVYLT